MYFGIYEIRPLKKTEWDKAMQLVWDTFMMFEAPEYETDGIISFRSFIKDPLLKKMFINGGYRTLAAFDRGVVVGMAGLRKNNHLSLLFVDGEYQHKGIGSCLLRELSSYIYHELGQREMTVNASSYGRAFYEKLGFEKTSEELKTDGIIYTPMKLILNETNARGRTNR